MIDTIDFDAYARQRASEGRRPPLAGALELTWRCNLRCVHCYMAPYRRAPELDTREILRVLDQLADAGCLRLLITGGEPLLRDDFREIWRYAHAKGFLLTLYTNATLVDDEIAAFLADHPPMLCEVSLYGASPETYERVCGRPDAFRAALDGLDRLNERLSRLGVKSMALRENSEDMSALARLCDERGLDFNFDTDVFPRLDRDPEPLRHAHAPERGVELAWRRSPLHRRIWEKQTNAMAPDERRSLRRASKTVACRAGQWSFHIGPYGDLCLCSLLREPHYSLRDGDFIKGWSTTIAELIERERAAPSDCLSCEALDYCVPCAGRNLLETGSTERPAPVHCARSHALTRLLKTRPPDGRREEVLSHVVR